MYIHTWAQLASFWLWTAPDVEEKPPSDPNQHAYEFLWLLFTERIEIDRPIDRSLWFVAWLFSPLHRRGDASTSDSPRSKQHLQKKYVWPCTLSDDDYASPINISVARFDPTHLTRISSIPLILYLKSHSSSKIIKCVCMHFTNGLIAHYIFIVCNLCMWRIGSDRSVECDRSWDRHIPPPHFNYASKEHMSYCRWSIDSSTICSARWSAVGFDRSVSLRYHDLAIDPIQNGWNHTHLFGWKHGYPPDAFMADSRE
jgi:hypothetical protein